MNTNKWFQIAAVAFACVASPAKGKHPVQTLCVNVDNQAHVPAGILNLSKLDTAGIFHSAGIDINWRDSDEGDCLLLTVVRHSAVNVSGDAMGFAYPFADSGARATILYDRIDYLADRLFVPRYLILGHFMAHELGHVLLRTLEHSKTGLMQASWDPPIWHLAALGLIGIAPEQREGMIAGVRQFQTTRLLAVSPNPSRPPQP